MNIINQFLSFFENFDSQVFNNIVTPLVTACAAIIYYRTLNAIKRQSKDSINQFKFVFFREKIEKEKDRLSKLRFRTHSGSTGEVFNAMLSNANGLAFGDAYEYLHNKIVSDNTYLVDIANENTTRKEVESRDYAEWIRSFIYIFISGLKFPFLEIGNLINEIFSSELDVFQKKALLGIIKEELIKDYIHLIYKRPSYLAATLNQPFIRYGDILIKFSFRNNEADKKAKVYSIYKEWQFEYLAEVIEKYSVQ